MKLYKNSGGTLVRDYVDVDAAGNLSGSGAAFTLAASGFALADGAAVRAKFPSAASGAITINVNGTGAKSIVLPNNIAVTAIAANAWVTAIYSSGLDKWVIGLAAAGSTPLYLHALVITFNDGAANINRGLAFVDNVQAAVTTATIAARAAGLFALFDEGSGGSVSVSGSAVSVATVGSAVSGTYYNTHSVLSQMAASGIGSASGTATNSYTGAQSEYNYYVAGSAATYYNAPTAKAMAVKRMNGGGGSRKLTVYSAQSNFTIVGVSDTVTAL